jgi:predicted DNA-binding mobile mystery protein A
MNHKGKVREDELQQSLEPFREVRDSKPPPEGWVRAVRESLGMTNVQLAARMGRKAAQTVEDMQKNEVSGAITLRNLRALAEAMECRLVYAVVPAKSFNKVRRDRARVIAARQLEGAVRPVGQEGREARAVSEKQALDDLVQALLDGSPRKLWEPDPPDNEP